MKSTLNITRRMRRLRQQPSMRTITQETWLNPSDLVQPLFAIDGHSKPQAIESMPGQYRYSLDALLQECEALQNCGVQAIDLFPALEPSLKDASGSQALNPNCFIFKAIQEIKNNFPGLWLMFDVALDPYTTHGHDGIFNKDQTDIDNDTTIELLCKMSCIAAEAGADTIAPSDMMDGRVQAIRSALDEQGHQNTSIMAYSAKYSSAYYGPFRDAVGSAQVSKATLRDKKTYQMNPANTREALIEAALDEEEGADILMVKPAGPYLDIVKELRSQTHLPIAAYQVSGEYAQIHAAAQKGWLNLEACRDESLLAIKRAGADMIFTYFAKEVAQKLNE